MTDREKAALAWLSIMESNSPPDQAACAHAIKTMLAEPRMPANPNEKTLAVIWSHLERYGAAANGDTVRAIYRALYDHLAAPKTKTVEVWRADYAVRIVGNEWLAKSYTASSRLEVEREMENATGPDYACIRITGPHTQEVPA